MHYLRISICATVIKAYIHIQGLIEQLREEVTATNPPKLAFYKSWYDS